MSFEIEARSSTRQAPSAGSESAEVVVVGKAAAAAAEVEVVDETAGKAADDGGEAAGEAAAGAMADGPSMEEDTPETFNHSYSNYIVHAYMCVYVHQNRSSATTGNPSGVHRSTK